MTDVSTFSFGFKWPFDWAKREKETWKLSGYNLKKVMGCLQKVLWDIYREHFPFHVT